MNNYLPTLNAFIEDTCVLVVIAYALARGRLLLLLASSERSLQHTLYSGAVFGLIGCTEILFPGARSPYVVHTLIVTFATLTAGYRVGLLSVVLICSADGLRKPEAVLGLAMTLGISVLVGVGLNRVFARHRRLGAFAGGLGTQGSLALLSLTPLQSAFRSVPHTLASALANGVGALLLQIVVEEAQTRVASERHRLEAAQAHAAAAQAQLVALRARVHPHFLFNALTSIAALCGLAPAQAESAVLRLSQLMRRALESNATEWVTLAEELEFVRGYLEIEQYRMGDRLTVLWSLDPAANTARVPAFALQTLVENAVTHGLSPQMRPGVIRIFTRKRVRYTLAVVADTGIGMRAGSHGKAQAEAEEGRTHGLQLAGRQLALLYGPAVRIRLLTQPEKGTVAAFILPDERKAARKPGLKKGTEETGETRSADFLDRG